VEVCVEVCVGCVDDSVVDDLSAVRKEWIPGVLNSCC